MARARRTRFAASFVVCVAACGGSHESAPAPTPVITTAPNPVTTDAAAPTGADAAAPDAAAPARALRRWSYHKANDGSCLALIEVHCTPGGHTCNPPPMAKIACPPADVLDVAHVEEIAPDQCIIALPPPTCPPRTMCNPPAPMTVPCPEL